MERDQMSNTALIKVPTETAVALRQIASALNTTVAGLLGGVVLRSQRDGILTSPFPGAWVDNVAGAIFLTLTDNKGQSMGLRMVGATAVYDLADEIDAVAAGKKNVEVTADDLSMKIVRNGRTVIFAQDDQRRVIATSAIPQLTGWLRSAANEVEEAQPAE